jgi:hypothetical protein
LEIRARGNGGANQNHGKSKSVSFHDASIIERKTAVTAARRLESHTRALLLAYPKLRREIDDKRASSKRDTIEKDAAKSESPGVPGLSCQSFSWRDKRALQCLRGRRSNATW